MSGPGFNITDRVPLIKTSNQVDIFSASDLPALVTAPDGVQRTPLAIDTKYIIHNNFTWPRVLLPVGFSPNTVFQNTIITGSAGMGIEIQVDGDDTAHFWGRDIAMIQIHDIHIVDRGNSGAGKVSTCFDLVGGDFNGFSFIIIDYLTLRDFNKLGSWIDIGLQITDTFWSNNKEGIVTRVSPGEPHNSFVSGCYFIQGGFVTAKPMMSFLGDIASFDFTGNVNMFANNDAFFIDSGQTGTINFASIAYNGVANFFRPNVSLSLTAMAAVNKSITSVVDSSETASVTSVTDATLIDTFGSNFVTSSSHNFKIGDQVVHTGMAEGSYNGTFTITNIISPTIYNITAITFVATDTGAAKVNQVNFVVLQSKYTRGVEFRIANSTVGGYDGLHTVRRVTSDEDRITVATAFLGDATADLVSTRVTTASAHPMVRGETVTISGTTSYNGTFNTLFVDLGGDTFDIPVEFVANDATGTVVSVSQTEETVGISVNNCGAQKDSNKIGAFTFNGNTIFTSIIDNTYVEIDMGTVLASVDIERFSLADAGAGKLTYDGVALFNGTLVATFHTNVGSVTEANYRFAISINDATPVFASAVYMPLSLKDVGDSLTLVTTVSLNNLDTIKVMIAGEGTGVSDVIIAHGQLSIR